jgi:hypothetical protein
MNGQMDPCEVLAVELRQYLHEADGQSIRTLVPRVHGLTATAKYRKKVTRTVSDPGIYILEPIAEAFEAEFGMQPRRRMHRRGWIRMDAPGERDRGAWLIYQSKGQGTINLNYDGGSERIDETTRQRIHAALQTRSLPDQAVIQSGLDSAGQNYVRVEISGFVFDDDSNWDELRAQLQAAMKEFLQAVDSLYH